LMMSLWDALRMNMMISYQELVRTFLRENALSVHEYVLNDGIGCLTSCNRGTGLDISSERCFRLKIIQRDKSAQQ
ncbi:hypothetical protein NXG20_26650, partial [Klebsiella pneumoniae]|uniref:hypothetical protein n=1 Tax=Klebsiella pneumoniae TaxID=573 RepID=UPI00287E083F|nr:hypothetical protein [Klebsiella pneumoniae]MDS6993337.1 hypothetical protein [Klebsiella pneumoniae]MDS7010568.1 hypothetical protein [Klebsiella pneumoniae]MDS7049673.1 hypothetical protein [Klebsiella pneumoniae]MDS7148647.1 hypothetical protein [Klebsiella pneumoniae]